MSNDEPSRVVQRQLDAYNAHDLDALMATYAADAKQYALGGELLARGAADIRARMEARLREPHLHAHLVARTRAMHIVIDHEIVTRDFPEGLGTVELVAIYEVRDGKIQTQTVSFGEKKLRG